MSASPLAINIEDDNAYHYLTMCIQEFEQAALESNKRAGFLAVANGTTYGADVILDAQERSLKRVDETRKSLNPGTSPDRENEESEGILDTIRNSEINSKGVTLVDEDVDLLELFGNDQSAFANYLEDCIGCSLRLKFDWQLKPLNLLGQIDKFLDQLNLNLDKLKELLNPFRILEDICWALNHLKTLCPQDLIMILLALKGLLKRYLLNMFNIKLDWTVLLGPLLQALLSAITDLLDNIVSLLLAPLDCVVAGLDAANDLERAAREFALSVQGAGRQVDSFFENVQSEGLGNTLIDEDRSGTLIKDVSWSKPDPDAKKDPLNFFNNLAETGEAGVNVGYDPGHLNVKNQVDPISGDIAPPPEGTLRVPAGFVLTNSMTLDEALTHPNFSESTWIEKILIPVREALNWFRETYQKYVGALESLGQLCGGSLGLSMTNIGALLFILDMIALIKMIYKLLQSNIGIKDWCSHLQQNPALLEEALNVSRGVGDVSVIAVGEGDNTELLLRRGPQQVGVVQTCGNKRSSLQNSMIENWVREIEARGAI